MTHPQTSIQPLPGFKALKSMVYAGVFPLDATEFQQLEEAIGRVCRYMLCAFHLSRWKLTSRDSSRLRFLLRSSLH